MTTSKNDGLPHARAAPFASFAAMKDVDDDGMIRVSKEIQHRKTKALQNVRVKQKQKQKQKHDDDALSLLRFFFLSLSLSLSPPFFFFAATRRMRSFFVYN